MFSGWGSLNCRAEALLTALLISPPPFAASGIMHVKYRRTLSSTASCQEAFCKLNSRGAGAWSISAVSCVFIGGTMLWVSRGLGDGTIFLPTYLCLSTHLFVCLSAYLSTYLSAHTQIFAETRRASAKGTALCLHILLCRYLVFRPQEFMTIPTRAPANVCNPNPAACSTQGEAFQA